MRHNFETQGNVHQPARRAFVTKTVTKVVLTAFFLLGTYFVTLSADEKVNSDATKSDSPAPAASALPAAATTTAPLPQASFGNYPAPDEMYSQIYALEKEFPENARVFEYGKSVEGRPLLAVRISLDLNSERPAASVLGNIHGNEWIGNRAAMAVARRLLEGRASEPWIAALLAKMDFYILPCLNPDGYYKTWQSLADPSIPPRNARKNAHKVDLNRNFPLPGKRTVDMSLAGSDNPDNERYTGPAPYSEPETAALRDFFTVHPVFASVDFHSNWANIFPPKCNSGACEKNFHKMCAAGEAKQTHTKYPCVSNRHVDSFSGELEDTLFYDFGAMAVCWEIFTESGGNEQAKRLKGFFWESNPEDIDYWTSNEQDAAIAALGAAYDITGGKPLPENLRKVEMRK